MHGGLLSWVTTGPLELPAGATAPVAVMVLAVAVAAAAVTPAAAVGAEPPLDSINELDEELGPGTVTPRGSLVGSLAGAAVCIPS